MIEFIKDLFGFKAKDARPEEVKPVVAGTQRPVRALPFLKKHMSHREFNFVRDVIDSCKLETQIASAIDWIHGMYRKNFFSTEIYHELVHHAMHKEEKILAEKVQKEYIIPHLKRRADEIIAEERNKNIRIVKEPKKADIK